MKRVLVVEDDKALLNIYRKMIGQEYVAFGVGDGEACMKWLEENELPDLVFLDLEMPKKDGLAVIREMKAKGWLEKVPVVVLSNYGNMKVIDEAQELGAVGYIKKEDIEIEEVMEACRKYLGEAE